MLSAHDIKKPLGIEEVEIKQVEENDGYLRISVEKKRESQICPIYGLATNKVDDYRRQNVKDISSFGRAVVLVVHKRRYRCCRGKCFNGCKC